MSSPAALHAVEGLSYSENGNIAIVAFADTTMSRGFLGWLSAILDALEKDDRIEAAILTGSRSVFMAGADLPEVSRLTDDRAAQDFLRLPHRLMSRVYHLEKPLIAAINGYCLGGGMELALACDFRIAAGDLRDGSGQELEFLGLPETRLGLVPALGGVWLLAKTIGRRHALDLLYSGAAIGSSRALEIGLIDRTVPRAELLKAAEAKASGILANSRTAIRGVKRLLGAAMDGATFDQSLVHSAAEFAVCCHSGDKDERLDRFRKERVRSFQRQAIAAPSRVVTGEE
jgi:enoyl-CoA hydratase